MFLTNAPQVAASPFCEKQNKSRPFVPVLQKGSRQVKSNSILRTRSALFLPAPGIHTNNAGFIFKTPGRWGWGQNKLKMPQQFPTQIQPPFSWLIIHLMAVNLWLVSRVPIKLIMTVSARLFTVLTEDGLLEFTGILTACLCLKELQALSVGRVCDGWWETETEKLNIVISFFRTGNVHVVWLGDRVE